MGEGGAEGLEIPPLARTPIFAPQDTHCPACRIAFGRLSCLWRRLIYNSFIWSRLAHNYC